MYIHVYVFAALNGHFSETITWPAVLILAISRLNIIHGSCNIKKEQLAFDLILTLSSNVAQELLHLDTKGGASKYSVS